MKLLLVVLLFASCITHAGYTKEHIKESCDRYKTTKIMELHDQVSYFQEDGTWFFNTYIHAVQIGLREFKCERLIDQLEEDYN